MKSNKLKSAILFLVGILPFFVQSQIEYADEKIKWKFRVEQKGCEGTIIADVQCAPHWHFCPITLPSGSFGFPTKISVLKNKDIQLVGKFTEPKPVTKHDDEADEDVAYHEGKVQFKQKFKTLSSKPVKINISYEFQACDESHCLPPFSAKAICTAEGCEVVETNNPTDTSSVQVASSTEAKNNDKEDETKSTKVISTKKSDLEGLSLWLILLKGMAAGLLALFTPCVFPMIPMTVSFFTKRSKDVKTGRKNALLYGISIIVIYITLGVVVSALFGKDAAYRMASSPIFNFTFFALLIVFAVSFMGAFEIKMPSSWINKADSKADRGGYIGIFFMALVLALVSFSCTGIFVANILGDAATKGGIAPIIGMFGFSFALAIPFVFFSYFPSYLNSLPSSGGWLNTVKVVLGLAELALAFKFFSNGDMALQLHWLERESFLAIWIAIFGVMAMYLFGFIRFPHDDKLEKISVGRGVFGIFVLAFVIYMIPGLSGAPVKLISAFPPPNNYAENIVQTNLVSQSNQEHVDGMHLGPQNIQVFTDYEKAKAYAEKVGKPLFVDFTGHTCVNCRKMEQDVWGQPGIIDYLRNDVVIASLHVDEDVDLPKSEQTKVKIDGREIEVVTVGDKYRVLQMQDYNISAQPYYVMIGKEGKQIPIGPASYETHSNPDDFKKWLEDGLKAYKK